MTMPAPQPTWDDVNSVEAHLRDYVRGEIERERAARQAEMAAIRRDVDTMRETGRQITATVNMIDGKLMVWGSLMDVAQQGFRDNQRRMNGIEQDVLLVETSQAAQVSDNNRLNDAIYGNALQKDAPESIFGILKRVRDGQAGMIQVQQQQAVWIQQEIIRRTNRRKMLWRLVELAGGNWKNLVIWAGGFMAILAALLSFLTGSKP